MPTRLLLDPAPGEGGGGPPAGPAAATAPSPAGPQTVTITLDQLNQFQAGLSSLAQLQQSVGAAETARRQAEADRLAAEGKWKEAMDGLRNQHAGEIKAQQDKAAGFERIARTSWRDGELTRAIAAVPDLVPGAAAHLFALWKGQFEAHPEGETFAVRTGAYQSPGDFIATELAKPEYALFRRASTRGGAGGGGGNVNPNPNPGAADPFAALGTPEQRLQGAYAAIGLGPAQRR